MPLQISPENSTPARQNTGNPEQEPAPNVAHLLQVPMRAEAILGTLRMKVGAISSLQVGTVLKTSRPLGEPLDLTVNAAMVASAEICPQGKKLGLRVVELLADA